MARATLKKINDAISARYPGREIEFVKGAGYFYFSGDDGCDLEIESIYTFALNQMPLEKWLERVFDNIDTAIKESEFDDGPGYEKDERGVIVMRPHKF